MTYVSELNRVKSGQIGSLYLLYGEEVRLMRDFETAVIQGLLTPEEQTTNLLIWEQEPDIWQLINQIETVPFLARANVIIVHNTHLFRSSRKQKESDSIEPDSLEQEAEELPANEQADALLGALENLPAYTTLIFAITCKMEKKTYREIDKRCKLYKAVGKYGVTVETPPLQMAQAREWIQDALRQMDKHMNEDAREHFMAVISLMPSISLGFLKNELEKLDLYTGTRKIITKQDILAVMSAVPEASIFALIEAASRKQVQDALRLLDQQLTIGVYPLVIVSLLARQVRLLWQIKDFVASGRGGQEMAHSFKLPSFVIERLNRQSRGFTVETLKKTMLALSEADRDLKSGQANLAVLEILVINMCR